MIDLEFLCIEDYLQGLTKLDIYATQISPGSFSCRHREFQLPKLTVGDRSINTSLLFQAAMNKDYFYIILPKNQGTGVSVNGKPLRINQPLVFSDNQDMLVIIPSNYPKYCVIVISSEELAKSYGTENIGILKKALKKESHEKIIFSHVGGNLNHLNLIIESLLNQGGSLTYQAVMDVQETIIGLLSNLLKISSLTPKLNNIKYRRQFTIVTRALNYIHKKSVIIITVPELAKASCCCVRNLEYSFKAIIGMTPKQYIIKRRLQLIHSTLKKKNTKSIAELTKAYGVVNQGRFAQDYFKFFNEYPHQTRDIQAEGSNHQE
jgi:AraC family ethanolamine operon transcriptional activator|tara:strand:+ start:1982 stop:2941 length:960 start_codon:yes stop_codon:yes gene_type:complete